MNQQKIGDFLKQLRKDKGLTQEQLAEHFSVSSRTVSRWETGTNMPDIETLIELADFYDVDIREVIDGERKCENADDEIKDTAKKVAEYATEENKKRNSTKQEIYLCLLIVAYILVTFLPSIRYMNNIFGPILFILLLLQLLLCFIGRKVIIRLIPAFPYAFGATWFKYLAITYDDWAFAAFFEICIYYLAACCAAWIIWGVIKLVTFLINKRKKGLQNENEQTFDR